MTNQNQNTDTIRPDPIEDSDGKDDFTEGKPYIEEVHKMTIKGDLKPMSHYAFPKDSVLDRFVGTVLKTMAGANKAGKVVGKGKNLVKYVIPYGHEIDALTDKVGTVIRNELTPTMENSKPWYKSVTVNSIIVLIVLVANEYFGIQVTEAGLQELIESAGQLGAAGLAIWGRIRANTKISKK